MATEAKPCQEIVDLHSDMVKELAGKFSVKGKAWRGICNQIVMRGILSDSDLGDVENMDELFIILMKRKQIHYGDYETIRKILDGEDVDATRIIKNYTELIKRARKKKGKRKHSTGTDTDTEVKDRESKRGKGNPSFSRDSDSKAEDGGGKSTRGEEKAGNLRKNTKDTQSANIVYTWQKAMDAVGFIEGPVSCGTGFRVGKDKIMTAYHVVQGKTRPFENAESDLSNLEGDTISITFKYLESKDAKNTEKFYFKKLCLHDEKMDFAILQLRNKKDPEKPKFPNPITRFKSVLSEQTFTILGHPGGEPMQLDPKVKIFDPTSGQGKKRLKDMEKWWADKKKLFSSEEIFDEKKVLFDCWVQKGASGSPGIEMDSKKAPDGESGSQESSVREPVCSLMLLHGYPDSAFDKYELKEEDHPYMIEEGVTMKAIADKISRMGADAKEIKQEIFADTAFE